MALADARTPLMEERKESVEVATASKVVVKSAGAGRAARG